MALPTSPEKKTPPSTAGVLKFNVILFALALTFAMILSREDPSMVYASFLTACASMAARYHLPMLLVEIVVGIGSWALPIASGTFLMVRFPL